MLCLEHFRVAPRTARAEGNGVTSQEFCDERACFTRFTSVDAKGRGYVAGLRITTTADEPTFAGLFEALGVPTS
jgi:hypothetical protein